MNKRIILILILIVSANSIFAQRKSIKRPLPDQRKNENVYQREQQAIRKAVKLYKADQLDEAKRYLQNIIQNAPNRNWPKAMLALVEFKKGQSESAEKLAIQVLKKENRSVLAHLVLAGIAKQKDQKLAAADHLRKANRFADQPYEKEMIKHLVNNYNISERPDIKVLNRGYTDINVESDLPYVAVFPFEDSIIGTDSTKLGKSVSEMMVTAMIQTKQFKVIERNQLDKLLEEQALGQSGALDEQTALEVGNILGVNAIVIGSISVLNETIEMDSRLLNAANGEAIAAASGTAKQSGQIRETINQMANVLAKSGHKISTVKEVIEENPVSKPEK